MKAFGSRESSPQLLYQLRQRYASRKSSLKIYFSSEALYQICQFANIQGAYINCHLMKLAIKLISSTKTKTIIAELFYVAMTKSNTMHSDQKNTYLIS